MQNVPQTSDALPEGVVHVWVIGLDVDQQKRQELSAVLSDDEKARAARFHFERDRNRFVVGRASLRTILSSYLALVPESIQFSYSEYGKPSISAMPNALRFNLSHSDELGLLAITNRSQIGADIEKIRPEVETDKLAERFFSQNERLALRGMAPADRVAAFYRGWACKEALLKAWGSGLSRPLHTFDVDLQLLNPAALLATRPHSNEANRWSLRILDVKDSYAAAIAIEGTIANVTMRRFPR
jgi:4'-phosphopantetheinyl transferase